MCLLPVEFGGVQTHLNIYAQDLAINPQQNLHVLHVLLRF